nr:hypothetical protein CFP56_56565 [Quercus suber]
MSKSQAFDDAVTAERCLRVRKTLLHRVGGGARLVDSGLVVIEAVLALLIELLGLVSAGALREAGADFAGDDSPAVGLEL